MTIRTLSGLAGLLLACVVQAQNPVAHWSFDAGSHWIGADVTDHGYDLVAVHKNSVLRLVDGVRERPWPASDTGFQVFVRESKGAFNFDQGTVEAIVFHIPTSTSQMIFVNTTYRPNVAEGYHLHLLAGGRVGFNTGSNFLPGSRWSINQSSQLLLPYRAYHVAATFNDHGINRIFINGQETGSTVFVPYTPSSDLVRVGQSYGDFRYEGYLRLPIDELKVYDQALMPSEIQAHYLEYQASIDSLNAAQP